MIKNICIIEDPEDFEIIFKRVDLEDCLFIPLDIKTFLICKKNKVNIFNFNENLTNKFHEIALEETKKFIENLKFKKKTSYSLRSEIAGYLRFRLHSIIFIIEIIEQILDKYKIDKIIVSGVTKYNHKLHNVKICSEIVNELYPDLSENLINNYQDEKYKKIYTYVPDRQLLQKSKKILLGNGGYNLKRLNKRFRKKGFTTWLTFFQDLNIFEKLLYLIKGYKIVCFSIDKKTQIKEEIFIEKINFSYKNKYNLSNLLNNFNTKLSYYFNDLKQKIVALKKFVSQNDFSLLVSNLARGLDGAILDDDLKQPSLCIPHGVISKSLNKYDMIYKKNIAEAVFNGESDYFAIQSKIMHQSLETHKIGGKAVITGNLIFSHNKNKDNYKNKYLLYATTLKGFTNMQYLGVDMFYEFWEIMKKLDQFAKNEKKNVLVKIHPQFSECKNDLKRYFRFLTFSNKPIENLLQNAISLITLSSGTIEDALNSKVPVILYDYKKRYKQIECNNDETGAAVFYIDDIEKIKIVLNNIKVSKKINYEKYVFKGSFNSNFDQKILPLINFKND